jgi:hypothetical protein
MRWHGIFKLLSQDGSRADFLKTSAPLSLIKVFRMNLISAGEILLDSTFIFGMEKIIQNRRRQMKDDRKAGRKKKMKGKQKGEGRMEDDRKEERRRQNGK